MKILFLLLSIALIVLISRKINISYSILISSLILSFLLFGNPVPFFEGFFEWSTVRTLLLVALAVSLGSYMEKTGMLENITESLKALSLFNLILIPMLIGLLPMPGGALVSAVMIYKIIEKYKIDPEKATFLNYWFRHVWVPFWPLYPSVIIAISVLEMDYWSFALSTFPISLAALFSSFYSIKWLESNFEGQIDLSRFLKSFYPIIILVFLTILGLDILISLSIVLLLMILHKRTFKIKFDWKILVLVLAVSGYKNLIETAEIAEEFLNFSFLPPIVVANLLSFTVAFATGIELSYSSIALPILADFAKSNGNLILIVASGYLGVMLSPLHLCYILTAEHFRADLVKTYKFLIPAALFTYIISILFFIIINFISNLQFLDQTYSD